MRVRNTCSGITLYLVCSCHSFSHKQITYEGSPNVFDTHNSETVVVSCEKRPLHRRALPRRLAFQVSPRRKRSEAQSVIGDGDYKFQVTHHWPELPDQFHWQITHNVAVDRDNFLYVIHEGNATLTDHPSIFVFDPEGRYVRSFGQMFQGGGHGIEVRDEGGEQFLYVAAYQQVKSFAKLSLTGELVWQKYAPMESGVYAESESSDPRQIWGRDRFMPTNFAFLDDGGFFLADGYGSHYIHRYDKDANWLSCFGGNGKGEGKFNLPHGLWIDKRPGREPTVVVCDRGHNTLQYFTLDGEYLENVDGLRTAREHRFTQRSIARARTSGACDIVG